MVIKAKLHILSIDWDYFVPIDPINLWNQGESKLLMSNAWLARTSYLKKMTNGSYKPEDMLKLKASVKLPKFSDPDWVGIGESHANAYNFIRDYTECKFSGIEDVTIHHFDLHHDMWNTKLETSFDISAENWLRATVKWLARKCRVNIIWYIPEWLLNAGYTTELFNFTDNIIFNPKVITSVAVASQLKGKIDADMVYLCRSSGWTPPHLDKKFVELCKKVLTQLGQKHGREGLEERAITYVNTVIGIDPLQPRECFNLTP